MSLTNQRAQVPGYSGYIPGKSSQNKFGGTFAEISKNAYPTQPNSFLTTNIANNQFIQKQYDQSSNEFWGNSGKLSTFQKPNKEPIKHNKRVPAEKFVPQKLSSLTYEEAIQKKI